jgi:uncharacterized RDD family membrane protein YckC
MTEGGVSPVPREARPYQGQRAGLVTRLVAAVIDGALVLATLLVAYLVLCGVLFLFDPLNFTFPDPNLVMSLAAGLVVTFVYLAIAWWAGGRTYGCLVMGLRVVNFRGDTMRLGGALVRALFCTLFPIGLLWVAVSSQNRSVQDTVLRSSVIYDWQPRGATRPSNDTLGDP